MAAGDVLDALGVQPALRPLLIQRFKVQQNISSYKMIMQAPARVA